MTEPTNTLSEGQVAEFAYTDITKAPEQHRTVGIQYAMGMPTDDIHISTGYPRAYVERILNHPPVVTYANTMKKALDDQTVQMVGQWTKLLPKAIEVLERSMASKSDSVALRAATEYLDRERSLMFAKRKFVDGAGDNKILGTSNIDELKQNAAKLEGQDNGGKESDESAREARYLEEGDAEETVTYPEPAGFSPEPAEQAGGSSDDSGTSDDPGWPPESA